MLRGQMDQGTPRNGKLTKKPSGSPTSNKSYKEDLASSRTSASPTESTRKKLQRSQPSSRSRSRSNSRQRKSSVRLELPGQREIEQMMKHMKQSTDAVNPKAEYKEPKRIEPKKPLNCSQPLQRSPYTTITKAYSPANSIVLTSKISFSDIERRVVCSDNRPGTPRRSTEIRRDDTKIEVLEKKVQQLEGKIIDSDIFRQMLEQVQKKLEDEKNQHQTMVKKFYEVGLQKQQYEAEIKDLKLQLIAAKKVTLVQVRKDNSFQKQSLIKQLDALKLELSNLKKGNETLKQQVTKLKNENIRLKSDKTCLEQLKLSYAEQVEKLEREKKTRQQELLYIQSQKQKILQDELDKLKKQHVICLKHNDKEVLVHLQNQLHQAMKSISYLEIQNQCLQLKQQECQKQKNIAVASERRIHTRQYRVLEARYKDLLGKMTMRELDFSLTPEK